jgi:hypothetical protein
MVGKLEMSRFYIYKHLFDSGILLIIELNKKKGKKVGVGDEFYL